MFRLLSLRTKLMALGTTVLLIMSAYYAGKFVEGNACSAKASLKVTTKALEGVKADDEIEKAIGRLPRAAIDDINSFWMRD